MTPPSTQYAKSGDTSIAYQVVGDGPIDLVLVLGFTTHIELQWEGAPFARFCERPPDGAPEASPDRPPDWPPDWAALIASTSCAFFMEPAPRIPRPPAIDFRSASSMELSPPDRFLGVCDVPLAAPPEVSVEVDSMVSVT